MAGSTQTSSTLPEPLLCAVTHQPWLPAGPEGAHDRRRLSPAWRSLMLPMLLSRRSPLCQAGRVIEVQLIESICARAGCAGSHQGNVTYALRSTCLHAVVWGTCSTCYFLKFLWRVTHQQVGCWCDGSTQGGGSVSRQLVRQPGRHFSGAHAASSQPLGEEVGV